MNKPKPSALLYVDYVDLFDRDVVIVFTPLTKLAAEFFALEFQFLIAGKIDKNPIEFGNNFTAKILRPYDVNEVIEYMQFKIAQAEKAGLLGSIDEEM